MTGLALYLKMFTNKRVGRLRVIELRRGRTCLPGRGRVATLAGLLEEPAMWIRVTGCALFECKAGVPHALVRHGVALLAGNLNMRAGQREASLRVVELPGHLPVGRVMTALAFLAETPLVLIFVATDTGFRQTEIGLVQVLGRKGQFL